MTYVFPPHPLPCVEVDGGGLFPVRRIFCVGKNYADHVAEMGGNAQIDRPVFFTKPADAVVKSGATIPFPLATSNLHFEGELVLAMASPTEIFGYGAGCDLTRRDLQGAAKAKGTPWDSAKGFDQSAPVGSLARVFDIDAATLVTMVNGSIKQQASLTHLIWSIDEIITALSGLFDIKAGDLIFTGTPAGVGPLGAGDGVEISITGLPTLTFSISPAR